MNAHSQHGKSGVRPGAILRAMGADPAAIAPELFDLPHLREVAKTGSARPRVEIVREGDRVLKILAHCPCGEIIAIECDYAESATAAAAAAPRA